MLLISALWLAVVHALAPLAVPTALRGAVDGPARLAGVAASAGATSGEQSRPRRIEARQRVLGDEELRPPAPPRLRTAERTSDRSVPPLRSPIGLAVASAHLSVSVACLAPPAQYRVSYAAVSRGGHLPYYPTAPPLQG